MSFTTHAIAAVLLAVPVAARSQMDHSKHSSSAVTPATPGVADDALAGQAAFRTITEVVRRLEADPSTDWTKVDLEALRRHLVDMDDVVLRATVRRRVVDGGLEMDVTGTGRAAEAVRRMTLAHARELDATSDMRASAVPIPQGVRLTVRAERNDTSTIARIRGLGFVGLLTVGAHHAEHHVMIARGSGHH